MDYVTWLVIAGAIVAFLLVKRVGLVSPIAAREYLEKGAMVVDVRTENEYRVEHVPGAVNIPLDRLSNEIIRRVPDKDRPLLLHCLSGARSGMGKSLLKRLGYRNVFNLGSFGRAAKILGNRSGSHESG
jgi:phage shock protein E